MDTEFFEVADIVVEGECGWIMRTARASRTSPVEQDDSGAAREAAKVAKVRRRRTGAAWMADKHWPDALPVIREGEPITRPQRSHWTRPYASRIFWSAGNPPGSPLRKLRRRGVAGTRVVRLRVCTSVTGTRRAGG